MTVNNFMHLRRRRHTPGRDLPGLFQSQMLGSWIVGETTGSNAVNEEGGQDRGGKRPSYTGTAGETGEQRVCLNPMSSPTRKTPMLQLLNSTPGVEKGRYWKE